MMRHDETPSAAERAPFRTLLGHRLVQNEQGRPMHKSDGTAIWFEEAAEQLGVDTMRWMYLSQNPAVDLRFGTRHPDQPVTLQTPDGPATQTQEGVPTCLVTSTPADETRRRILIPLWNCYKFFVDYAAADQFSPSDDLRHRVAGNGHTTSTHPHPAAGRPEIDRWILSSLQSLIDIATREMLDFNSAAFCTAAASFIDDLSNWYIRRNRRRFWRSRDASDSDKNAAYETLYEVLVTLCRLLAPCIPFLTERMYQNLVLGRDLASPDAVAQSPASDTLPDSVHLCDWPAPTPELLDDLLNRRMAAAQAVVRLGHKLREDAALRVRQPLAELRFACSTPETATAVESLADVIREELNIHAVIRQQNLDDLVSYSYKPNLKTLGPRYGKLLNALRTRIPELGDAVLAPLRRGGSVEIELDGTPVQLTPEDVLVSTQQAAEWMSADDAGIQVAISTVLTPRLIREGMSRDFVRQIQQLRKDAGLNIQDRIAISCSSDQPAVGEMISEWGDYIRTETLADTIADTLDTSSLTDGRSVSVGDCEIRIAIRRIPVPDP
jgi:isoleucyl-tRNA synthetase